MNQTLTARARHLLAAPALALLALLAACGGGGDGGDGAAAPPTLPPAVPAPVTATLGAAGGDIDGPDSVRLQVPTDALATATAITVARADASAPALPTLPAGFAALGTAVSLTPHGTTFSVPVTLSLPLGALPAGHVPVLIKTNTSGDGWEQVPASVVGDRLVAQVTRFSTVVSYAYCGSPCGPPPGPPVITGQPAGGSVNEHGAIILSVDAVGVAPFSYQWNAGSVLDLRTERQRGLVINPVTLAMDGMPLRVTVTDALGQATTSNIARVTVLPAAPRQASGPEDAEVVVGSEAVFRAGTSSSLPQSLQWERKEPGGTTWAPVPYPANPTAQNAVLRVPATRLADDGAQYRLRATNGVGSITTTVAWLRVVPEPSLPVIQQAPTDTVVASGFGATFTVVATGGNLRYQWLRRDGGGPFVAITRGGESASYTVSNTVQADDGAQFLVRVSNSVGTSQPAPVVLTVTPRVGALPTRLAGGARHSMALDASGRLWSWGANDLGQAGRVAEAAATVAPGITTLGGQNLANVATFSTSWDHTLALQDDGSVLRWGSNARGQLLLEPATAFVAEPLRLPETTAAGRDVVAGVLSSGVLRNLAGAPTRVWGSGALGDGRQHTTATPAPVDITGMTLVRGAFGLTHSLAIRDDGSVFAWGHNAFGQLGLGDTVARLEPTQIPGLANVVQVRVGQQHSAALTADGVVYTWGANTVGELGGNSDLTTVVLSPRRVQIAAVVVDLACGTAHCLALTEGGRLYAWGGNRYGQLGDGTDTDANQPREVTGADWSARVAGIGAGGSHSLAHDLSGQVWAWGINASRQLGDGSTEVRRLRPVRVPGIAMLPSP